MKGSDLRIGNLLMGGRGPVQITKIFSEDKVGLGGGDPYTLDVCLSAIPLDEEWLIKFGFDYEKEHNLFKGLTINLNDWVQFYSDNQNNYGHVSLFLGLRDINYDIINQRIVTHVHQLQNLYFNLTGEELKSNS